MRQGLLLLNHIGDSQNTRFSQSSSVRRHLSDSGIDDELAREQLPVHAPRQVAPPVVRCLSLITCPALQAVRCLHFSPAGQHLLLAGQDLQGRLQLFVRGTCGTTGRERGSNLRVSIGSKDSVL